MSVSSTPPTPTPKVKQHKTKKLCLRVKVTSEKKTEWKKGNQQISITLPWDSLGSLEDLRRRHSPSNPTLQNEKRKKSPTYRSWSKIILNVRNRLSVWNSNSFKKMASFFFPSIYLLNWHANKCNYISFVLYSFP